MNRSDGQYLKRPAPKALFRVQSVYVRLLDAFVAYDSQSAGAFVLKPNDSDCSSSDLEGLIHSALEHLMNFKGLARRHSDGAQRSLLLGTASGFFKQLMIFHGDTHLARNGHEMISFLLVEMAEFTTGQMDNATKLSGNAQGQESA